MRTYRVLLKDKPNGESFKFAITIRAESDIAAAFKASEEFPECGIVYATRLPGKRI